MNFSENTSFYPYQTIITIGFLSILSIVFLWILLTFGPGISNDTLLYLESGNHLFSGKGFSVIGHDGNPVFASDRFPLFPVLLKVFSMLGITPLIFQCLLFLTFSFLMMLFLGGISNSVSFLLLTTIAIITLLFPFILVYYNLWTEGIFLILLLWILLVFINGKNYKLLLALLILLSLTRMPGIAAGIAIALVWMIQKKYSKAATALVCSILPVVVWAMLGYWLGNENSRHPSIHWISPDKIQQFFITLGSLFIQGILPQTILGILIFLAPAMISGNSLFKKTQADVTLMLLIILSYVYPLFLFFSISFLDYSTPLDDRILAPHLLLFILIMFNIIFKDKSNAKIKTVLLFLFALLSVVIHATDYKNLRQNGYGFNSKESREFSFNEVIKTLPQQQAWYSNAIHGIYYLTGKIVNELPLKFDLHRNKPNPDYEKEWHELLPEIKNKTGTIIWIRSGAFEKSFITYDELKNTAGFKIIYDDWLCLIMVAQVN